MRPLSKKKEIELLFDLINSFRIVGNSKESAEFLQDLFTVHEIANISKRLRIAKMLIGGMSQREIAFQLGCATATVTKINAWLNEKGDGFRRVIRKLPLKYNVPNKVPKGPVEFHLPQIASAMVQYKLERGQSLQARKLIKSMEDKRSLDKSLKKISDAEYAIKHYERI